MVPLEPYAALWSVGLHLGWFSLSDFAVNRLKLAEILYYKILETIMVQETRRLHGKDLTVSEELAKEETTSASPAGSYLQALPGQSSLLALSVFKKADVGGAQMQSSLLLKLLSFWQQ